MNNKLCAKCNILKLSSCFYRRGKYLSGYCKDCHLKYCREYILTTKQIEKYRNIDKEYQKKRRAKHSGLKTEEYRKYCRKFPDKVRAQQILNQEIRKGKIKRSSCVVCGSNLKVHAHHKDYSKPLSVEWLCPVHHRERHKKIVIIN
jgi:hypothetical protein